MRTIIIIGLALALMACQAPMRSANAQFFGPPMGQSAVTNPYGGTYYGGGTDIAFSQDGADGLHRRVQSTLACEHFTSLQPNDIVDDARGLVDVRADENAVMIAQEARA
jgi:hypothetical protein